MALVVFFFFFVFFFDLSGIPLHNHDLSVACCPCHLALSLLALSSVDSPGHRFDYKTSYLANICKYALIFAHKILGQCDPYLNGSHVSFFPFSFSYLCGQNGYSWSRLTVYFQFGAHALFMAHPFFQLTYGNFCSH